MLEPIWGELSEDELNRVSKGGLEVAERERGGVGMSANLGTKVNRRKRAVRFDPNVVENVGPERGDEGDGVVVEIVDARKEVKEVTCYEFFLWYPEFLAAVVNDGVLVRVAVDGVSAGGGVEKIGE